MSRCSCTSTSKWAAIHGTLTAEVGVLPTKESANPTQSVAAVCSGIENTHRVGGEQGAGALTHQGSFIFGRIFRLTDTGASRSHISHNDGCVGVYATLWARHEQQTHAPPGMYENALGIVAHTLVPHACFCRKWDCYLTSPKRHTRALPSSNEQRIQRRPQAAKSHVEPG